MHNSYNKSVLSLVPRLLTRRRPLQAGGLPQLCTSLPAAAIDRWDRRTDRRTDGHDAVT